MDEQVVLITGAGKGVGKNLCTALKKRGYIVAAAARDTDSLEETQADMKVEIDVTDDEEVRAGAKAVYDKFGKIDILVNNAGYSVRSAVEEMDTDQIARMFDVNVYGVIRMIKAVSPFMRKCAKGKIINIGSVSGRLTSVVNGGYCASKHALEAISEAARYELGNFGIQVTVIEPGAMDTDFFRTLSVNSDDAMNNKISPYYEIYQRDLRYRQLQKKASVLNSVRQMITIIEKKKLKVRYQVSLGIIFKILIHLPDAVKEKLILRFS
ncbi:MAG: SDR family oxidoreductase [Oscillospiraceae bacterium]|nr:SDR family oxidoreductase [Oscillospiraceae bacterium]